MKKIAVALVAVAAMSMTACGGNEEKAETKPQETQSAQVKNAPAMTEADLRKHLGVDEMGVVKVKGKTCEAAVVMTSPSQVQMYADAGDLVVTNPDGNLGVKVVGDTDGSCATYFMEKLSTL